MDRVAIEVHGKLTAGSEPLASKRRAIFLSSLQGHTRHALPSPENGQYLHKIFEYPRHRQHFVFVLLKLPWALPKGLNWRATFGRQNMAI
jgi:hypothetical protein